LDRDGSASKWTSPLLRSETRIAAGAPRQVREGVAHTKGSGIQLGPPEHCREELPRLMATSKQSYAGTGYEEQGDTGLGSAAAGHAALSSKMVVACTDMDFTACSPRWRNGRALIKPS